MASRRGGIYTNGKRGSTAKSPRKLYATIWNGSRSEYHRRLNIFELKPLDHDAIVTIIKRAVYDSEKGMGAMNGDITDEAIEFLAEQSDGDARRVLNAIELGILTVPAYKI